MVSGSVVCPERDTMLILDPRPLLKSTSVDWNRSVAGVTVQLVGYETENLPCGSEYFVILDACAITGGGVVVELGLLDFVVLVACAITGGGVVVELGLLDDELLAEVLHVSIKFVSPPHGPFAQSPFE